MVLDLTDLRAKFGDGPSDTELTTSLLAAYEAIEWRYGPYSETVTEHLRPYGQWVNLTHRALSVSSVTEGTTALEETDYELWPGPLGKHLRRLHETDASRWTEWVDVVYTVPPGDAWRDKMALGLVGVDVTYTPGLVGITVGPWSEQYSQSDDAREQAYAAVLASGPRVVHGVW